MRKSILYISFFIFIYSCSTTEVKGPSLTGTVQIKPGDSYEECVELVPDQLMHYSFTSSKSVNFNIHYHADESILYPVNEQNIIFWEDSMSPDDYDFYSQEQEYFCLMWENHNSGSVKVTFNYRVNTK